MYITEMVFAFLFMFCYVYTIRLQYNLVVSLLAQLNLVCPTSLLFINDLFEMIHDINTHHQCCGHYEHTEPPFREQRRAPEIPYFPTERYGV